MPASRPIWKGQLRLALVSVAVEPYTATQSNAKPSFRQVHEPSGKPVDNKKVVGIGAVTSAKKPATRVKVARRRTAS